jgi:hypothetical protein
LVSPALPQIARLLLGLRRCDRASAGAVGHVACALVWDDKYLEPVFWQQVAILSGVLDPCVNDSVVERYPLRIRVVVLCHNNALEDSAQHDHPCSIVGRV